MIAVRADASTGPHASLNPDHDLVNARSDYCSLNRSMMGGWVVDPSRQSRPRCTSGSGLARLARVSGTSGYFIAGLQPAFRLQGYMPTLGSRRCPMGLVGRAACVTRVPQCCGAPAPPLTVGFLMVAIADGGDCFSASLSLCSCLISSSL